MYDDCFAASCLPSTRLVCEYRMDFGYGHEWHRASSVTFHLSRVGLGRGGGHPLRGEAVARGGGRGPRPSGGGLLVPLPLPNCCHP